ncbi:MAG TPA: cysteate synthase [Coleofasciculaceae cyanobacterium]
MSQNFYPSFSLSKYTLRCSLCGAEYEADPFRLHCDMDHQPALLRAIYRNKRLEVQKHLPGLFQFMDWLPIEQPLEGAGKPITYESKNLAQHLGLDHLFISFNGYYPQHAGSLVTCSFKELEAFSVLAGIPKHHPRTLVIASAGNTGRAFASVCSEQRIPLCLVIPEKNLSALWSKQHFHPRVCLIVVGDYGDYSDAIALGQLISKMDEFFPEGGAANVARRDGMGLTVLDAAVTLGRIPDHYFQAVGSGTGGIAAWEANLRLLEDGRFGTQPMKLHLSQNVPFTPMVEAWKAGIREPLIINERVAKEQIGQVTAQVLTNRNPAYSLSGGLYEALTDTQGEMYSVTNPELERARILFEELEGIDIGLAAGVATASLLQAVAAGKVGKRDYVLLNITSGGFQRMQRDSPLHQLQPDLVFSPREINPDRVAERIQQCPKFSALRSRSPLFASLQE